VSGEGCRVADLWYYSKLGSSDRLGPISADELRKMAASGEIGRDDLIWKDGMADWVPAKSAKGLFSERAPAAPPPLPRPSRADPWGSGHSSGAHDQKQEKEAMRNLRADKTERQRGRAARSRMRPKGGKLSNRNIIVAAVVAGVVVVGTGFICTSLESHQGGTRSGMHKGGTPASEIEQEILRVTAELNSIPASNRPARWGHILLLQRLKRKLQLIKTIGSDALCRRCHGDGVLDPCPACGGSGWATARSSAVSYSGGRPVKCSMCGGRGTVTCPRCHGTGKDPGEHIPDWSGQW